MALTAALAAALAAVGAAAALGLPAVLVAAALVPGIIRVVRGPHRPHPAWFDVRVLAWLTGGAAFILYVTGLGHTTDGRTAIARVAVLAVVPLSLLWPEPSVIRYSVLLSAGALVGAGQSASLGWPVAGVAGGAAVALVAARRLSTVAVPPLAARPVSGAATRRRRVAGEAVVLLAVAGLVGLLAVALLPPPTGGNRPQLGRGPSRATGPAPPYLQPAARLDTSGRGSGTGKQVVLKVSASGPALWRTQTFGTWDGRFWQRSPQSESDTLSAPGRFAFVPPVVGEEGLAGVRRLDQRITVEADAISLLAAASRATTVQLPGGRLTVTADGTLLPAPSLGRGSTYVVTSFLLTADASVLRTHNVTTGSVPPDVARLYLGFPALPDRVPGLAAQITSTASTSYDKARSLQVWLATNTKVVAGTPPLPAGADPIDQFLLTKTGSSEQAATAMAVMLRSLGIPTRLAVGYLPGERSPLGGPYVVRARDARAWVEVWFPDVGWVSFDPAGRTPGASAAGESWLTRLRHLLGALASMLVVILAAALAWAGWTAVAWWRRRRARPWVTRCYERLSRAGKERGRPREPSETPAEYAAALAAEVPDDRLVRVGDLLTVAAYADRVPPPEAQAWADAVVHDLERRPTAPSRGGKSPPG